MKKYLVLALVLLTAPAFGASLEASFGRAQYDLTGNGIWWDSDYPVTFNQPRMAYSLGLAGNITPDTTWRVGYIDFGKFNVDAIGKCDDTNAARTATCRFVSDAHVKGLYAGIRPGFHLFGARLFVEGGGLLFKPQYSITMPDMPSRYGPNEEAQDRGCATGEYAAQYSIAPYLGFGVDFGRVTFSMTYYDLRGKGTNQYEPVYKGATVGAVSIRF